MNLKILNSKQIKEVLKLIKQQWGFNDKLDYAFLKNEKNKIFLTNKQIFDLDFSKLRINSLGLEFATIEKTGEIRLSIEGSQIIGKKAKKNILELNKKQIKKYLKGEDLEIKTKNKGFQIIKYKNYFCGTGKYKQGKILNFVPKERRLNID